MHKPITAKDFRVLGIIILLMVLTAFLWLSTAQSAIDTAFLFTVQLKVHEPQLLTTVPSLRFRDSLGQVHSTFVGGVVPGNLFDVRIALEDGVSGWGKFELRAPLITEDKEYEADEIKFLCSDLFVHIPESIYINDATTGMSLRNIIFKWRKL